VYLLTGYLWLSTRNLGNTCRVKEVIVGIDLDALEAAMREATPGPWAFDSYSTVQSAPRIQEYEFDESVEPDVCKVPRTGHGDLGTVQGVKDAELIVAAVNALPGLIRELRELRADRERPDWLNAAFGGGKENQ
jgi:hypothetical protein